MTFYITTLVVILIYGSFCFLFGMRVATIIHRNRRKKVQ